MICGKTIYWKCKSMKNIVQDKIHIVIKKKIKKPQDISIIDD